MANMIRISLRKCSEWFLIKEYFQCIAQYNPTEVHLFQGVIIYLWLIRAALSAMLNVSIRWCWVHWFLWQCILIMNILEKWQNCNILLISAENSMLMLTESILLILSESWILSKLWTHRDKLKLLFSFIKNDNVSSRKKKCIYLQKRITRSSAKLWRLEILISCRSDDIHLSLLRSTERNEPQKFDTNLQAFRILNSEEQKFNSTLKYYPV